MTVLWPDYEAALVVVFGPAGLIVNAQVFHTVIAVGVGPGRSRGGGIVDDFAQRIAPAIFTSLTVFPGAVVALLTLNWYMYVFYDLSKALD
jgi:hypothetical protein